MSSSLLLPLLSLTIVIPVVWWVLGAAVLLAARAALALVAAGAAVVSLAVCFRFFFVVVFFAFRFLFVFFFVFFTFSRLPRRTCVTHAAHCHCSLSTSACVVSGRMHCMWNLASHVGHKTQFGWEMQSSSPS